MKSSLLGINVTIFYKKLNFDEISYKIELNVMIL
jgi:hypothetical protein